MKNTKTETVEEFLARGGKVQKSDKEMSLESLLYNEGLMNHEDAKNITESISKSLHKSLDESTKK